MDQKALSHLDPKARETYDRVMNTAVSTENPVQNTPAPSDTMLGMQQINPSVPDVSMTPSQTPNALPSSPSDLTMADASPAPLDANAPSIFSATPVTPDAQNATSSFFTNPAPDSSASTPPNNAFSPLMNEQTPTDTVMASDPLSPATPITPYTPLSGDMQPTPAATPIAQPLPSPAAINQPSTHETSPLLKVLYIVGAVVFFAIYTIFWIKVFKLPFLF